MHWIAIMNYCQLFRTSRFINLMYLWLRFGVQLCLPFRASFNQRLQCHNSQSNAGFSGPIACNLKPTRIEGNRFYSLTSVWETKLKNLQLGHSSWKYQSILGRYSRKVILVCRYSRKVILVCRLRYKRPTSLHATIFWSMINTIS